MKNRNNNPFKRRRMTLCLTLLAFILVLSTANGFAAPQGGQIVGGSGSISQSSTNTLVNQQSQSMAINWQSFNLSANESITFQQPNSSSVVLNRIQGNNASQIFGQINANGRVLLANPNGVIFGPTARINVGGLLATGMTMDVNEFMQGKLRLYVQEGMSPGVVINQGTIQAATGGSVSLIGGAVENSGAIIADYGRVNLATGSAAVIDFDQDGLMTFKIDEAVAEKIDGYENGISNSGNINAQGGEVLISSQAAKDVFANVVNNSGIIKANKIDRSGGVIRLVGSGAVLNTGELNVSSDKSTGGSVHVLGDTVVLKDNAFVDASGLEGGGEVLIGGGFQGNSPDVQNAEYTSIGSHVQIKADAYESGDGGTVIAWADVATSFKGSISATGGKVSGDGGFVEISGKEYLDFNGEVDLRSETGDTGSLLLDPRSIVIGATADIDGDLSPNTDDVDDGGIALDDYEGADSLITAAAVEDIIKNTDLTLQATEEISLNETITKTTGAASTLRLEAPTISLSASIELAGTLTLEGTATNVNVNSGGSIQNAIDVSSGNNSIINIADGTYVEPLRLIDKYGGVTLQSVTQDPAAVIIAPVNPPTDPKTGVAIDIKNNTLVNDTVSVTLKDLTITNAETGVNFVVGHSSDSLTLDNVILNDNDKGADIQNIGTFEFRLNSEANTLYIGENSLSLTTNALAPGYIAYNGIRNININTGTGDDSVYMLATPSFDFSIDGGPDSGLGDSIDFSSIAETTAINVSLDSEITGFESITGNGTNFTLSNVTHYDVTTKQANNYATVSNFKNIVGDNQGTLSNLLLAYDDGDDKATDAVNGYDYSNFKIINGATEITNVVDTFNTDDGNGNGQSATNTYASGYTAVTGSGALATLNNLGMAYNDSTDSAGDGTVTYSNFATINNATAITDVTGTFNVANGESDTNKYGTGYTSVTGLGALATLNNLGMAYSDSADSASDGTVTYSSFATINNATAITDVTGTFDVANGKTATNQYGSGYTSVTGSGALATLNNLGMAYNDSIDSASDGTVIYSSFATINNATAITDVTGTFNVANGETATNQYGSGFTSVTGAGALATLNNLGMAYNDSTDSASNGTITYSNFATINNATAITNITGSFDVATRETDTNKYGAGYTSVTGSGVLATINNLGLDYNDSTDSASDGTITYSNFAKINGATEITNANAGFTVNTQTSGNDNQYGGNSYTRVSGAGTLDGIRDYNLLSPTIGSIQYIGFTDFAGDGLGTLSNLGMAYNDSTDSASDGTVTYRNFATINNATAITDVTGTFNVANGETATNQYGSGYTSVTGSGAVATLNNLGMAYNDSTDSASDGTVTYSNFAAINNATAIIDVTGTFDVAIGETATNQYGSGYTSVTGSGALATLNNLGMAYNDSADSASDGTITYSNFATINNATAITNVTGSFNLAIGETATNKYGSGYTSVTGAGALATLNNLGMAYNDSTDSASDGTITYSNFATINNATAITDVTGAFNVASGESDTNKYGLGYTSVSGSGALATLNNLGLDYNDSTDSASDGTVTYSNFAKINGATEITNANAGFTVNTQTSGNNNQYGGNSYTRVSGAGTLDAVGDYNLLSSTIGSIQYNGFTNIVGDGFGTLNNLGMAYNDSADSATDGVVTYSNFATINNATGITDVISTFDVANSESATNKYGLGYSSVTGSGALATLNNLGMAYNDSTDSASDGTVTYSNFATINNATAITNVTGSFNVANGESDTNKYGTGYTSVTGSGVLATLNNLGMAYNDSSDSASDGMVTYSNFSAINNATAITNVTGSFNVANGETDTNKYGFGYTSVTGTGGLATLNNLGMAYNDSADSASDGTVTYSNFATINNATAITDVTGTFDVAIGETATNKYGSGYTSVTGSGVLATLNNLGMAYNDSTDSATDGTVTYSNFATINGATTITNVTGPFDVVNSQSINNNYGLGYTAVTGAGGSAQLNNLGSAYNDGDDRGTTNSGVTYSNFDIINGATEITNANAGFDAANRTSKNGNSYGEGYTKVSGAQTLDNVANFDLSSGKDGSVQYVGFTTINGIGTGTISAGSVNSTRSWVLNGTDQGGVTGAGVTTTNFSGFKNIVGSAGVDLFEFESNGKITGSINGLAGVDTLDMSDLTTAASVVLGSNGSVDGYAGTENSLNFSFNNINEIKASSSASGDQLTGMNAISNWLVGSTNTYSSGNTITFANFEKLNGGNAADNFSLAGSVENLAITGGNGTDILTLSNDFTASSSLLFDVDTFTNDLGFTLAAPKLTLNNVASVATQNNPLFTNIDQLEITNSDADIFITESNSIDLIAVDNGTGVFSLATVDGSITHTGAGDLVSGDVILHVNSANNAIGSANASIRLANTGLVTAAAVDGNGGIYLSHSGDIQIAKIDAGNGNVSLAINGALTDALGADDQADIVAKSLLINNNSLIGRSSADALNLDVTSLSLANTSSDAVFISNGNGVFIIDSVATGGDFNLQTSGAIIQTDTINVGGNSVFNAGSNGVTLSDADDNQFGGTIAFYTTGRDGNVSLTNRGDLTLAASTIGGTLSVESTGKISQSGSLNITGATTFDAASHDIIVTDSNNLFTGAITLITKGNADATVVARDSLTLEDTSVDGNLSLNVDGAVIFETTNVNGNLSVEANGEISQNQAISVLGDSTFATNNQQISLMSAANAFTGSVSVNTGNVEDDLDGQVFMTNSKGFMFGSSQINGDLSVTSNGEISQLGGVVVVGNSQFQAGNNSISLTHAENDFSGQLSATTLGSDNNIVITDKNRLNLGETLSAGNLTLNAIGIKFGETTVGGDLTVVSSGLIEQSEKISVNGSSSITVNNSSAQLTQANNRFSGALVLNSTGNATNLNLTNSVSTELTSLNSAGNVNIQSGGALTQTGVAQVSGASNFGSASGSVVLTNVNNDFKGKFSAQSGSGNNISVVDKNGLLVDKIVASNGTVDLSIVSGKLQSDFSTNKTNISATVVNLNADQVGSFDSPMNVVARNTRLATETGGYVVGNYGDLEIIAGLFVDPLSNARVAASQQTTNLQDVVFIDAGLFSQNLSLFSSVATGIRLPADQLEEPYEDEPSNMVTGEELEVEVTN